MNRFQPGKRHKPEEIVAIWHSLRESGQAMTKESFGTWFRVACKKAGVPGRAHGLSKAGATRVADAGATEYELMALYGWDNPRTAAIYTRKANRIKLAQSGSDKRAKART